MNLKMPTTHEEHRAYQAACAKRRERAAAKKAQKALSRDPAHRAKMEALLQKLLAED